MVVAALAALRTAADDGRLAGLAGLVGTDLVDLLVLEGASPTARRNALSGVLPLHESEEGLFARTQVAAVGDLDTAWMRRDALARMAGR